MGSKCAAGSVFYDSDKARWEIEVFFHWIKQHLNVPCLFGTTENAVYCQLFVALAVYVLMKTIFDEIHSKVPVFAQLTLWNLCSIGVYFISRWSGRFG
ncbi:transposase [Paenibacillus sp. FSL R7-0128]|uniref:transposase n=1 Tax=Paenibacillus sp. FSL R7-0128 TaxID=2954529 RepID=UPI004040AE45